MVICGLEEHPRRWLPGRVAAPEGFDHTFGMPWTVVPPMDEIGSPSGLLEDDLDRLMNIGDILFGEYPPGNAALIGDDDQDKAGVPESAHGLGSAFEKAHSIWIAQITIVLDDRVVSIQEDASLHGVSPIDQRVMAVGLTTMSLIDTCRGD